jgi:hypothetical protein
LTAIAATIAIAAAATAQTRTQTLRQLLGITR